MTAFSPEVAGRLLARYALHGRLPLEALDSPPALWSGNEADRRVANDRAHRLNRCPLYPPPADWRNLAREWIAANPTEWEAMLRAAISSEDQPTTSTVPS